MDTKGNFFATADENRQNVFRLDHNKACEKPQRCEVMSIKACQGCSSQHGLYLKKVVLSMGNNASLIWPTLRSILYSYSLFHGIVKKLDDVGIPFLSRVSSYSSQVINSTHMTITS